MNGSLADAFIAVSDNLTTKTSQISSLQGDVFGVSAKTDAIATRVTALEDKQASDSATLAQTVATTAVLGDKVASTEAMLANLNQQIENINSATSSADVANLQQRIDDLVASLHGATPTPTITGQEPTIAATASATQTPAATTEGLTSPDLLIATDSAIPDSTPIFSTATVSGEFTAYTATVTDTFKSFGKSYLGDTTISGDMMVNGQTILSDANVSNTLTVDKRINVAGTLSLNENSLNVTGSPTADNEKPTDGILYLQNSTLANLLDIFNGAVVIDKKGTITTKGEVKAASIEVKKDLKVGGNIQIDGGITITATAGATIKAGDALYISAPGVVKKANAANEDALEVTGVAANNAAKDEQVTIIVGGKAKGFKNLEAGKRYFLGTTTPLTNEVPDDALKSVPIGIAFSQNEMIIQLGTDLSSNTTQTSSIN